MNPTGSSCRKVDIFRVLGTVGQPSRLAIHDGPVCLERIVGAGFKPPLLHGTHVGKTATGFLPQPFLLLQTRTFLPSLKMTAILSLPRISRTLPGPKTE